MTAKEYMHIQGRICNYYKTCHGCPVHKRMYKDQPCIVWICDNFEEFTSIVRQWAEEHPEKTMLQDLLEKYPDVERREYDYPVICPRAIGFKNIDGCSGFISMSDNIKCAKCWNRPLEE